MYVTVTIATKPIPHPRWPHDRRAVIADVGDLVVTAGNETRAELAERLRESGPASGGWWWAMMYDLFEPYFCNGSFEPFDAGQGDPFVGLTDTCCVAEELEYLDDPVGEGPLPQTKVIHGRLWYFEEWALADPLEQLRNRGRTVFRLALPDQ